MNTKNPLGKRNEISAEVGTPRTYKNHMFNRKRHIINPDWKMSRQIIYVSPYSSPYSFKCMLNLEFFVYIQLRNYCHGLEMFKAMFISILWVAKLSDKDLSFLILCLPRAYGKVKEYKAQLACTNVTPVMLFTKESMSRPLCTLLFLQDCILAEI